MMLLLLFGKMKSDLRRARRPGFLSAACVPAFVIMDKYLKINENSKERRIRGFTRLLENQAMLL
jgi:hypothetical protein